MSCDPDEGADPAAPPAGWQAIRDVVMDRIRTRIYPPGALIPAEADLAAEFGCARATVNRALRDLAEAGFLDRRRKAGTRVLAEPVRKATLEIPLTRRDVEATGAAYAVRLLARQEVAPPAEVVERLGVGPAARTLYVATLHLADGRPHMLERRWVDLDTVPDFAAVDLTRISPNEWLVANAPYTHGQMRFDAVLAGDAAADLGCAPAQPVLRITRDTWLDARPITLVHQFYAPGHGVGLTL